MDGRVLDNTEMHDQSMEYDSFLYAVMSIRVCIYMRLCSYKFVAMCMYYRLPLFCLVAADGLLDSLAKRGCRGGVLAGEETTIASTHHTAAPWV